MTREGTQIFRVMLDRAQISRVMRDLLFSQRVTRDFPLKFQWWLISFKTRSRDIDRYDTNFLPQFFVDRFSTSGFLTLNDNRILVNVVNILFHFSLMRA